MVYDDHNFFKVEVLLVSQRPQQIDLKAAEIVPEELHSRYIEIVQLNVSGGWPWRKTGLPL